jgi:hypothetical protein
MSGGPSEDLSVHQLARGTCEITEYGVQCFFPHTQAVTGDLSMQIMGNGEFDERNIELSRYLADVLRYNNRGEYGPPEESRAPKPMSFYQLIKHCGAVSTTAETNDAIKFSTNSLFPDYCQQCLEFFLIGFHSDMRK